MLESGGKITEAVIIDGVRQEMIYWERKREGLEMSVVDNIREIIMLRKYDLRRGYAIFQNTLVEDETQLCQLLCRIFDEEEKEIEKEHQKSFVTDDYEKDITIWISKRTRERSTIGAFQGCMKLLIRL